MRRGPRPTGFFQRGASSHEIQWQSFDIVMSKYAQVTWCKHGKLVCAVATVKVYDMDYCAIAHGDGGEFFTDVGPSTFTAADFPKEKNDLQVCIAAVLRALELRSQILARATIDDDEDGVQPEPGADKRRAWSARGFKARAAKGGR
jgi:hypothetical protein